MLYTIGDIAAEFGVTRERIRLILHTRKRKGLPQLGHRADSVGHPWLFTRDEVNLLRPRPCAGRPPARDRLV